MIDIPDAATRIEALNPKKSFIVQAPAGSGKTTLLAMRYLKLLSTVDKPEEILAITFTKKAAAEMRSRVLELLCEEGDISKAALRKDAEKNWQVTNNPNRLKILTIDALANEIARQGTADNTTSNYAITDSAERLYLTASERMFNRLYLEEPAKEYIANFLEFCSNDIARANRMVTRMLEKRNQWLEISQLVIKESIDPAALKDQINKVVRHLREEVCNSIIKEFTQRDHDAADSLAEADNLTDQLIAVGQIITTKKGQLRKRLTIKEHPKFKDKDFKSEILSWIDSLANRNLEKDFLAVGKLPDQANEENIKIITDCCVCMGLAAVELEELINEIKEIDFTGISIRAQNALTDQDNPSDLALQLDYRIEHILIDEFQDTSRSQLKFFSTLIEGWQEDDGHSFFAVGDPMQSIYSFRDADISVFAEAQRRGINQLRLKNLVLSSNFRSDPKIVEWINSFFSKPSFKSGQSVLGEASQIASIPVLPTGHNAQVICGEHASNEEEIGAIIDYLRSIRSSTETVVILCRSRNQLQPLLEQMAENSVSWQANDIYLLSGEPLIRDLLALHESIYSPTNKLSWLTILRSPLFGFKLKELEIYSLLEDIKGFIHEEIHSDPRLVRLQKVIKRADQTRFEFSPREVMETAWIRLGGADAYQKAGIKMALVFFESLDDLGKSGYQTSFIRTSLTSLYSPSQADASNIQIMTIHKAKGLEFDHVIVPFLARRTRVQETPLLKWDFVKEGLLLGAKNDSIHDWLNFQSNEQSENENKRLLYVALTRAKTSLFMSYVNDSTGATGGLAKWFEETELTPTENAPKIFLKSSDKKIYNELSHLPKTYTWKSPVARAATSNEQIKVPADKIDAPSNEMVLGELVHLALAWISRQPQRSLDNLEIMLERWILEKQLEAISTKRLSTQALAQIQDTLKSDKGRWILADHKENVSEFGMTGILQGEIRKVFVDRMFVDRGVRWIVDYKSGAPDFEQSVEAFIETQLVRYKPQLALYREFASHIYSEDIRTGLFFTALSEFRELDI